MDLNLVAERLATAAGGVEGIVGAYSYVPDQINPPCFYVGEITEEYDQTFGGMVDVEFLCRVLVTRTEAQINQKALRRFMARTGTTSVKAALEADSSLGGACDDLQVRRIQGHRMYQIGEVMYYGAEWVVRVIGTDSGG